MGTCKEACTKLYPILMVFRGLTSGVPGICICMLGEGQPPMHMNVTSHRRSRGPLTSN
jgi:hypothetical protein